MREMERLRLELALFFCEDPQTFKLEDCFKIFHNFCISFAKAIEENNERKIQEEKREMRRRQIKEQEDKFKAKGKYSRTTKEKICCKEKCGFSF